MTRAEEQVEVAPPDLAPDETPDPAPDETAEPETPAQGEDAVPAATVTLRYEGRADQVRHGSYKFRRGQPVTVPSDVAEELLTLPFEKFVVGE